MSAQIIAALRRRADALEQKAKGALQAGDARLSGALYGQLAAEFRSLADEAEGREPQTGVGVALCGSGMTPSSWKRAARLT